MTDRTDLIYRLNPTLVIGDTDTHQYVGPVGDCSDFLHKAYCIQFHYIDNLPDDYQLALEVALDRDPTLNPTEMAGFWMDCENDVFAYLIF